MKLIIQIPCYNEEETLPIALKELPRKVEGFDTVEWLIINDGSVDKTVEVAKENGVDHVVSFKNNQGLARGFMAGLSKCLKLGADVIVNTDADNQYDAKDIPTLVKPILDNKADIVIGSRPIEKIKHFSFVKKLLQKLGSYVVRMVSKTSIKDAPSGFRAISRDAAMQLNVFSEYTYTLETIIQAGHKNIAITSVPINTNEDLRPSRLVKSIFSYVKRSFFTMFRIFATYKPLKFFSIIGTISFSGGFLIGIRWLYYYFEGTSGTRVPSLILATILIIIGFIIIVMGILADLISTNRKILEELQFRARKQDSKPKK